MAIKVITAFLNYIPRIYIIVDGLDECQGKDDDYLDVLSELFCYSATGVTKWFITSRREAPIQRAMQNARNTPLKGAGRARYHGIHRGTER